MRVKRDESEDKKNSRRVSIKNKRRRGRKEKEKTRKKQKDERKERGGRKKVKQLFLGNKTTGWKGEN